MSTEADLKPLELACVVDNRDRIEFIPLSDGMVEVSITDQALPDSAVVHIDPDALRRWLDARV